MKGKSRMDNPDTQATLGTQDEDNPETQATLGTQDEDNPDTQATLGTQDEDNPDTQATLGTQDEDKQINVRENQSGNKKWTIQRHCQQWNQLSTKVS
jgi:hypothetical protein